MQRKNASKPAKPSKTAIRDAGIVAVFVGAISVLLLVACYVVGRLASERAYRTKWQDYNDCGWA